MLFIINAFINAGKKIQTIFEYCGGITNLLVDFSYWINKSLIQRDVRFGLRALHAQITRIGIRSIGIVTLVCSAIGFILAIQMQPPLEQFGQTDKIANIVGIAVFRELGPLIAAIVLTGFAGASIAAELGTMVVGEEIEALESQALNPVRFLVVPRIIATVISLFFLTILGDLVAVTASGLVTVFWLEVPASQYIDNSLTQITIGDFLTGLIKGTVFGILLSTIACYNGLRVKGGASGVGRATTNTVVETIVLVVISDLLLTTFFFAIGWA
tara:strand:- start:106 stop:918 length:813 start_codon:yes stop_codon:yes gene_type:complete